MTSHPITTGIYRVALIFGAGPLVVGTSIFLLWLLTGWGVLEVAGMFTIITCVLGLVPAIIILQNHLWDARKAVDLPRSQFWIAVIVCLGALLVNFPAAYAIMYYAEAKDVQRYVVEVRNRMETPIDDVRVFGGGVDVSYGEIPSRDAHTRRFWIKQDGELRIKAFYNGSNHEALVDAQAIETRGKRFRVTIRRSGDIAVVDPFAAYAGD